MRHTAVHPLLLSCRAAKIVGIPENSLFPGFGIFTYFLSRKSQADICTKYRGDGFRVDLGYFRGTKIVGGGSQVDRLLLELDDWITVGQVSAGAGTEARGDWIHGKWKEVVEF